MTELLLELFSEEIPARMQQAASEHLARAMTEKLQAAGLQFDVIESFVTPRRLALLIAGLPKIQPDIKIEKKGPKVGAPDAAMQGFLKSTGLTVEQLEIRDVGKDKVYFASTEQKGQPTAQAVKPMIEEIFAAFPWPKSMRWGSRETSWVRPLQNILCIFDGAVVPVSFTGLTANNLTYGHRFLAPEAITITRATDYAPLLEKAHVIACRTLRREKILELAQHAADTKGFKLRHDEGLLEEVTGLVEWPVVLVGNIDDNFMDLPPEVLTTVMRSHQKYFALEQSDNSLAPHFLITSNMIAEDRGVAIVHGNERVLRARLSDARFFWDLDRKKPLAEWATGLQSVIFHTKLGTIADKVTRVGALAEKLLPFIPGADAKEVARAVTLCKADLLTGMVGEFAELQGLMGRYYALQQKETPAVADAIRDHYLPLGPTSACPTQPVSIALALADKLDTLTGLFGAGEKPTGSKDPFALRRAALGVIRIILENNLRLPLKQFLSAELVEFFNDRLKVSLKEQGIRHDLIAACLSDGEDDFTRLSLRAEALKEFLATEDGANLLAAYRRAGNIVRIEEKKDGNTYAAKPDDALLQEAEEKSLFAALDSTQARVKTLVDGEGYTDAMSELASLRAPVDAFLDKVLVNAEDAKLRVNRLHLLAQIRSTLDVISDFSVIEG